MIEKEILLLVSRYVMTCYISAPSVYISELNRVVSYMKTNKNNPTADGPDMLTLDQ